MNLLTDILNPFFYWLAWIVIPLFIEIVPAIGSFAIMFSAQKKEKELEDPKIWPEIGLLIPVYNSEDSLLRCIQSINDSEYPNESIHIYLIDNGSADDSFGMYARAQYKYPSLQMQWLSSEQGKSRALNLAIYNGGGKYIVNIDSDGYLEKTALKRIVRQFEADNDIAGLTGTILTDPEGIEKTERFWKKLFRKLEFVEYAQAFMAGRNYASRKNSLYTFSGAFSAFRLSTIRHTRLYNTDTIAEDTEITFQIKNRLKKKIGICVDAIYVTDPIEDMNKLYTQRQRWQRGSIEVSEMYQEKSLDIKNTFKDEDIRTLLFDHTFAFPRMLWYVALIYLIMIGYSSQVVVVSMISIFAFYILGGYLYYFVCLNILKPFKDLRQYYKKQWLIVGILPFYNLLTFFIRFAGIINAIKTPGSWKTNTLTEERLAFKGEIDSDAKFLSRIFKKVSDAVNDDLDNR